MMKIKTALNVEKALYAEFRRKAQDNGFPIQWLLARAMKDVLRVSDSELTREYLNDGESK